MHEQRLITYEVNVSFARGLSPWSGQRIKPPPIVKRKHLSSNRTEMHSIRKIGNNALPIDIRRSSVTTSYFLNEEIRSWFTSRSRGRARTSLKPVTLPVLVNDISAGPNCPIFLVDSWTGGNYSRETTLRRCVVSRWFRLTSRKCKNNRRTIFVVSSFE